MRSRDSKLERRPLLGVLSEIEEAVGRRQDELIASVLTLEPVDLPDDFSVPLLGEELTCSVQLSVRSTSRTKGSSNKRSDLMLRTPTVVSLAATRVKDLVIPSLPFTLQTRPCW